MTITAKKLVASELQARPELIRATVEPLLARLRRAQRVTVRIHPEDRAELERMLEALRARGSQAQHAIPPVDLEVDAAMARGGCLLESNLGSLDARVETQLQALARALGSG